MEFRFYAILCSTLGNDNSHEGHIKFSCKTHLARFLTPVSCHASSGTWTVAMGLLSWSSKFSKFRNRFTKLAFYSYTKRAHHLPREEKMPINKASETTKILMTYWIKLRRW